MFVGSAKDRIFDFDLNKDRTALLLSGTLSDKIADSGTELEDITFAKGFGTITDIKAEPDGYLYVVTDVRGDHGVIYRIVPGVIAMALMEYQQQMEKKTNNAMKKNERKIMY